MATKPSALSSHAADCGVDRIGMVAGEVWHILHEAGSQSPTQLAEKTNAPRDLVMQAVGWLAREGKLRIEDHGRRKIVDLA